MTAFKKSFSVLLSVLILLSLASGFSVSAKETEFEYRVLDDGTAEIVNMRGDDVVIPNELDGHIVSSIALELDSLHDDYDYYWDYRSIYSLAIPEGVKAIDINPFTYFDRLSSFSVDEKNTYFSSVDGNLYNKDKTKFIYYARSKSDSSFTVPNGVKEIGKEAFLRANYALESVVLPEGVEKIGDYAFSENILLSSVKMPDTVTEIGEGAFYNCGLKEIRLSENLKSIPKNLFQNCALNGIKIPKSVKSIGSNAFEYSFSKTSMGNIDIEIPEGVERIEEEAFVNANRIHSITIPASVKYIGKNAFYDIGINIEVNKNNTAYCSKDNALYNKDKTELLYCYWGDYYQKFIVPLSVKKIAENALTNTQIRKIYISPNVTEMDYCGLARRAKDSKELNDEYNYITIYGFKGSTAENYFKEHTGYLLHFEKITKMPEKTIEKNANPITVKTAVKKIKASALKKAKKTVKPVKISKAKGTVKVVKVKSGTSSKIYKKIKVNKKNGAITFNKGKYKKGTYKVKLKITASGDSQYLSKTVTKTVKIKIK